MSVSNDALMTGGNGVGGQDQNATSATTVTTTGITVGASATLLVSCFVWQSNSSIDPSSRTCTWNGVSMTERSTILQTVSATDLRVSIFTLVSPASGAKSLTGNWTGATDVYMSAASFNGTDTVTGINASDNVTASAATQITVTSDTSGATFAVFGVNGNVPTVNFVQVFAEAPLNPGGGASYQLGGTSNIHTFTGGAGTIQALAGIHIISGATAGNIAWVKA